MRSQQVLSGAVALTTLAFSRVSGLYFPSSAAATTPAEATPAETASSSFAPLGSPTDVFRQGGLCRASWTPDTSGAATWKSMTIQLMTGSNMEMVPLGTVASAVDGTDPAKTVFNYTCPQVSPNAAVYFLQYTHDDGKDPTWTTRFAIGDANGRTVAAPEANQPSNPSPAIPWGKGVLVSVSGNATAAANTTSTPSSSSSSSKATPTSTRQAQAKNQQEQLANAFSSIFGDEDNGQSRLNYASGASRVPVAGYMLMYASAAAAIYILC